MRATSPTAAATEGVTTDKTAAATEGVTTDKTAAATEGVTTDKITVGADAIDAGTSTIRSAAGLDAVLSHSALDAEPSSDPTLRFIDIAYCEHRDAIGSIAQADITSGCNPPDNDRFCPNRPVTRAETASFLARAIALPEASTDYFDDDNDSTHEDSINRIALADITTGCTPANIRYFCPQHSVSRAQAATLLVRAFNLQPPPPTPTPPTTQTTPPTTTLPIPPPPTPTPPPTTTLPIPPTPTPTPPPLSKFIDTAHSSHREAIELLAAAGIGFACNPPDNDRFCPDREVTRAEMAELLTRALSRAAVQ